MRLNAAHKCLVNMHSRATSLTRALRAGSWTFRSLRLLKLHHGSVAMAPQLRYHDNRRKSLSRLVPGTNQASLQVDLGMRSVRDHGSATMTPRLRYHGSAPLRLNARRAFRKRRGATRRCRERQRCEELLRKCIQRVILLRKCVESIWRSAPPLGLSSL